jgi:membrane protease YdiL (CAAX protease family)
MQTNVLPASRQPALPTVPVLAWAVIAAISILPDVLFAELTGAVPGWLAGAKLAGAGLLLLVSFGWAPARPLRLFATVVLALLALGWLVQRLFDVPGWQAWLAGRSPFVRTLLPVQAPRLVLTLVMTALLWLLLRDRRKFYFTAGHLSAVAAPIPLIMTRPTNWRFLGPFLSVALTAGLTVFMLIFGKPPSAARVAAALPFIPLILIFAAANAYGEELNYRAALLAPLENVLGPSPALLLTALYFGMQHYYGMPYGVLGVLMSALVGWLMGKAMLETRGFFWAWCIHFCMDVAAFGFIAFGAVAPGG